MPAAAAGNMLANGTLDSYSTSQKRLVNDSTDADEDCVVFGVLLSEDRRTADDRKLNRLILGSIVVDDASARRRRCNELRNILQEQFPTLTGNFVFLSRDGWPILRNQENSVRAGQVINERNAIEIQRDFGNEKSRVAVTTESKSVLGFICCDLNATLQQARENICEQLKEIRSLNGDYLFLERNAWPVTKAQEGQLMLLDICSNDSICVSISKPVVSPQSSHGSGIVQIKESAQVTFTRRPPPDEPDGVQLRPRPKKDNRKTLRKLITWGGGGGGGEGDNRSSDLASSLGLVAKPILISYVRAEAATHAILLKEALMSQGFSVYLDVHEIRTGNDWQDALNFAVSNCTVFVPLITPQYGMTQWTNREVKLADVLNKFIIPVNFLDRWPPECLAIQFASTQYICWKPAQEHSETGYYEKDPADYSIWKEDYVVKVAQDICKRCQLMFSSKDMLQKLRHTVKVKDPKYRKEVKPASVYALDNNLSNILEEGGENVDNNFVVISTHPKDFLFALETKKSLTDEGFNVWSSIELLEENPDGEVFSSCGPLSTIPEGESCNPSPKLASSRVDFEVPEKRGLCRLSSQMSTIGGMTESLSPETIERLRRFQQKVDQAGVVIILISQAFTDSTTSLQQVFYCEHRKKVVLVKMDNKPVKSIYSMLMGNDMLTNIDNPQILQNIVCKVKRCLNNKSSLASKEDATEAKMKYLVKFMKQNLPEFSHSVYISGSTRLNERSNLICQAIGQALAKIKDVNVVTGGFYGAGDVVAKAFKDTRVLEVPNNYAEAPVIHILPTQDSQDLSQKANQNEDGTFDAVPYGKTVFLGDSVKERESAVARLFDICIVVEGGPGAAHEVEEFIWNDHYVIPIISTGGAAGGQFGVPLKILETPPAVSKADWAVLSEKEATPEQVAQAVASIVKTLNIAVTEHAKKEAAKPPVQKGRRRSRKSKKKKRESQLCTLSEEVNENQKEKPSAPETTSFEINEEDETVCSGPRKLQKFFKMFKSARIIS